MMSPLTARRRRARSAQEDPPRPTQRPRETCPSFLGSGFIPVPPAWHAVNELADQALTSALVHQEPLQVLEAGEDHLSPVPSHPGREQRGLARLGAGAAAVRLEAPIELGIPMLRT